MLARMFATFDFTPGGKAEVLMGYDFVDCLPVGTDTPLPPTPRRSGIIDAGRAPKYWFEGGYR